MKATMTDLHRRTAKVMGAVIHAKETVEITDNGNVVAKIVPVKKFDPVAALKSMRAFADEEPITLAPRK